MAIFTEALREEYVGAAINVIVVVEGGVRNVITTAVDGWGGSSGEIFKLIFASLMTSFQSAGVAFFHVVCIFVKIF